MTIRTCSAAILLATCGCVGAGNGAAARLPTCEVIQPPAALPDALDESSGIVFGRRDSTVLWTHNDSGGEPRIYAVRRDGSLVAALDLPSARNRDWEDIAVGACEAGSCLYIGDIGDNGGARGEVLIYRVAEPSTADAATERATPFRVRYPGGPRDAEALFTLPDGGVYIISKGRNSDIAVYRYPPPLRAGETVELERVAGVGGEGVALGDQVTAAGASPDGEWVAVRTYSTLSIYRTAELLAGRAAASVVDLGPLGEAQGEAVAITDDLRVALTSEASGIASGGSIAIIQCSVEANPPTP